jgi:hypothetical protein
MCQQLSYSATYCHSHFSLRQITFHVLNSGVQVYVSTNSLDASERQFPCDILFGKKTLHVRFLVTVKHMETNGSEHASKPTFLLYKFLTPQMYYKSRDNSYILIMKANEMPISPIYLIKYYTCFGQVHCPSSGVSQHCIHALGICHASSVGVC